MNENYNTRRSLIIYFSRADENYGVGYITKGNTEVIAEYIRDITEADIFKVERERPYPKDYASCIQEALEEHKSDERPRLVNYLKNISKYDMIYIGSPVYWEGLPVPMYSALEGLDFTDKAVRIFVTHEGSGLSKIPEQIAEICKGARILPNSLAIRGSEVYNAKDKVEAWIEERY